MVADYCRITLFDVQKMDYIDYLLIRRDAFIHERNQTPQGQEYLDNAYRLEQTKPERKRLRSHFGER